MRVLVVEDDVMIGAAVRQWLQRESYAVDWIRDGMRAASALIDEAYDLIVLDLGLPRKDGMELLGQMRKHGHPAPVLIITARDALADRVGALDAGADDYLVKPFDLDELAARLRALARRRGGRSEPAIEIGQLCMNPATHDVMLDNRRIHLTMREFSLLRILMEHPDRPFSRAELERRMYGWDEDVTSNVIEYYISALRRKLGPRWVRNLRGVGWLMPGNS
ncbi:MAG: response regulator transcription factor [Betaproteobacteria bacterium]|nr:response regulator transcription factor [Betaproteobacteria bacterium]